MKLRFCRHSVRCNQTIPNSRFWLHLMYHIHSQHIPNQPESVAIFCFHFVFVDSLVLSTSVWWWNMAWWIATCEIRHPHTRKPHKIKDQCDSDFSVDCPMPGEIESNSKWANYFRSGKRVNEWNYLDFGVEFANSSVVLPSYDMYSNVTRIDCRTPDVYKNSKW